MDSSSTRHPPRDVAEVRRLAEQVMALATSPRYEERRRRWRDANERRRPDRAPVWCRPAGAWQEILPPTALQCADPLCRRLEYALRQHLYKDWIGDDHILEPYWPVPAVFRHDREPLWGLPTHQSLGTTPDGGFSYYHPVETPADYARITVPEFTYDAAATAAAVDRAREVLGGVMPVCVTGSPPIGPHQGTYLEQLRGMLPMMEDMILHPDLVHQAMATFTEAALRAQRVAQDAGVLTPNHNEPMTCSDPLGGPPGPSPVVLRQLWTSANSQEFDLVSPEMQEEFLLGYQKVVFAHYGAVQYGCCESLTTKIPIVLRIPNLRVFVCSFWSDLEKVIEGCAGRCTIMWRQSAAQVTVNVTLDEHRRHLEIGLQRLRGQPYQVVLRELQTLHGRPDRLRDWARLAIGLAEKYA